MKKSFIFILTAVIVMTTTLTGCSKKETPPTESKETTKVSKNITLRFAWWGNQVRNERTQKIMDMYSQKYPNIKFEAEMVAWDGYWDKLATQTAANNLPDLIQQDYAYIGQYVDKKLLEDLNPYVKSGVLNTKDISTNVISSGSINNGLYAISLGTNAMTLLYDAEIFKKAGVTEPNGTWDWKQYEDTITKVYKATGIQAEPLYFSGFYNAVVLKAKQGGKSYFSTDGTSLGFTDEKIMSDLFEMAQNLTKAGVYTKPDDLVSVKAVEDNPISKGTAFITSCWSNQLVAFSTAAKKSLTMTMPPMENGKSGLYLKPSQFISVSAKSENKEEAVKFANYMVNDIEANKILLAERGVPVSSVVRDGIKSLVDENTKKTFDYVAAAEKVAMPINPADPPGAAEVNNILKSYYDQVVFGKVTPKDAATKFMKEANAVLAKNKK